MRAGLTCLAVLLTTCSSEAPSNAGGRDGEICATAAECAAGLLCIENRCRTPCITVDDCVVGYHCSSSGYCLPGGTDPGDPEGGDPIAGDPESGDPAGDPFAGDPFPGDPVAGDPVAGDPFPGDPLAGDPFPGDPLAGDPFPGDPLAGDPFAGDPVPGDYWVGSENTDGVPNDEVSWGVYGNVDDRTYVRRWTATHDGTAIAINFRLLNTDWEDAWLVLYNGDTLVGSVNIGSVSTGWTGERTLIAENGQTLRFTAGDVLSYGIAWDADTAGNPYTSRDPDDPSEIYYSQASLEAPLPTISFTLSQTFHGLGSILHYQR